MKHKKLNLIIVGAQKAGTTSLNNYLRAHPEISGHKAVEFSFFADPKEYQEGFDSAYDKLFDCKEQNTLVSKNVTIAFNEAAIARIKEHNPAIKLVFILREPVSRAYSAYTMAVKDGWMQRSFAEFREILSSKQYNDIMYRHFIKHGLYAEQLKTILKYFPSEQLKIYLFEDLKENPQQVCNDIFKWLDLVCIEVAATVHNSTVQPRSIKLGGFLNKLRNNENPVKKLVKSILPNALYSNLGNKVQQLNKSTKRFPAIENDIKEELLEYFEKYNQDLLNQIHQLDHQSLCIFSQDNWLLNQ